MVVCVLLAGGLWHLEADLIHQVPDLAIRYRRAPVLRDQSRADERDARPPSRNEPAELPRIARTLAELRGWSLDDTARRTTANAVAALPRLAGLMAPHAVNPAGMAQ